ncbi:MAG: MarR family winged helix-turn-helix transcriptional regulator [Candidatus Limnocylindria bacterium]
MTERQDTVKYPDAPVTRTPAGDELTGLILRVVRLSGLFTAKGESLARPDGQTLARWVVLDAAAAGPTTVARISRTLGYARQSVQRVADLLVADGLAVYQDNPAHRRAKLLAPTTAGRRTARRINERQKAWADALGAEIGEADLATIGRLLDRLLEAMREER